MYNLKNSFSTFALAILTMAFISCNTESYEKIQGEWVCYQWITSSGGDQCNGNASFNFKEDKTYSSEIGGESDVGTYKILEGKLYVHPKEKMEFAVELQQLTEDTMVFLMNQAGMKETLKLKRP